MSIRILVIEDESAHAEAIGRSLEEMEGAELRVMTSLSEFQNEALAWNPDIALMDLNLPDGRATEVLPDPRDIRPFPIIIMTSFGSEHSAVEALKSGAFDYLVKSPETFSGLSRTIERLLREWHLRAQGKLMQRELKASEAKFRSLAENSTDFIMRYDAQGRHTYLNPAALNMLGMKASDILGKTHLECGFPEDLCHFWEAMIGQVFATGQPSQTEFQFPGPDGMNTHDWRLTPEFDGNGHVHSVMGVSRDITERKRMEEVIQKRIIALTQPLEGGTIAFEDLFNIEDIQRIQDDFSAATGVASIIKRPDGTPLTRPSHFARLCTDIIRKTEKGCSNCSRSDEILGKFHPQGPIVQHCLSAGLWEGGASISVGDQYIANWLIGQVRDEAQTDEHMRAHAREIGADESAFMEAFHAIPVMSRQQFETIAKALFTLANQLSTMAYQNIQQARYITERKQAEDALRESEARYRSILNASPDAITITDLEGRIIGIPTVALSLFHCKEEVELLGHWITDFIVPEDRERALTNVGLMFEGTMTGPGEYRGLRVDGTTFDMEANGEFIRDAAGKPSSIVFVVRDISEHKRAAEENAKLQSQLQQAQKMESLGSLAGGVAHDMNNVLGAILGMASLNLETQPVDSPAFRAFNTIAQAALRGGQMVKSLLNFARQSPAEERELNVNAILREEIHLLEHTTLSKVRLEMDLAPELRPIRGDASALSHALLNLCVNAVDALPDNGTLSLRTRNVDNDWIEVTVEDNGTGMSKAVLEKALDPFFTTKGHGKGTGLGLSMVYSTVKAHQGQMKLESELGKGTCVRMRFPAFESERMLMEAAVEVSSELPRGALSVMVIDDDELIQSSISAILEVLGHQISTFSCGEDALAKLEAGLQPDVVILDMNMPGLGGAGTLPRLRALRPNLPVLLATGRADQTALDLVEAYSNVTLLSKPFSMKELQRHLEPCQ